MFVLMRRRPPRSTRTSTLCPATTLVRSRAGGRARAAAAAGAEAVDLRDPAAGLRLLRAARRALSAGLDRPGVVLRGGAVRAGADRRRSEEHTSELQSLMRISYAVFCLEKKI